MSLPLDLFERWPAWARLVRYVSMDDPTAADPQSIYGSACALDLDRFAALLYADHVCETIEHARELLDDLLADAREGRRPKSWPEHGITPDMFRSHGGAA